MHSFFCPSQNITKKKAVISDKNQLHHMCHVLRLKENDAVLICDENQNMYKAIISKASSSLMQLEVLENLAKKKAAGEAITVACAIPKGSRMDSIIDSLTQLGVQRIIPLLTKRVIVKLDEKKKAKRWERWKKIALQASQQCKRRAPPAVDAIKEFNYFLPETSSFDLRLIPTLSGENALIGDLIHARAFRGVVVLIGPEGDFTPEEVALAKSHGFVPVSLGKLVLRVDTAAIALAGYLRFTRLNHANS